MDLIILSPTLSFETLCIDVIFTLVNTILSWTRTSSFYARLFTNQTEKKNKK